MTRQSLQNEALMKDSIFIIGRVSSVEGRTVKIKVNKDKNLSHISYKGSIVKNVSVGSYIKIAKGFIEIIGRVEGEYITKEKVFNEEYGREETKIARFLEISLLGHFEKNKFLQGIKEMPLIDNECYLLDKSEFNKLHQFYGEGEKTIEIGVLTEEPSQVIAISISKLFASHIGIFGNTGSGKSNTLARIYTELFEGLGDNKKFKQNAHFALIDFNGEYTKEGVITKNKEIYNLTTRTDSPKKYKLKQSAVERLEVIAVLLEATEKTQRPFLDRALKNTYLDEKFEERSNENISKMIRDILQKADVNLSVSIFTELFSHLQKLDISEDMIAKTILQKLQAGDLKYHSQASAYYIGQGEGRVYSNSNLEGLFSSFFENISQLSISGSNLGKIKFKIISQYYHEIVNGYSNQEHIRPLMGRMFKKFDMLDKVIEVSDDPDESAENKSNLQVINLKEANLEMKKTLPLVIAKQLYDDHKEVGEFDKKSLHIIIDEAHNILSSNSERESETWKDYRLETFEEIIKEGRKFSTFLTVASQRPFDISATIISQLHNYFIHRLINDKDISAIEKTIAYLDKLSFESIPVLSVGSCFVAGLASDIPVKVSINPLPEEKQPKSETINLQASWFGSQEDEV